MTTLKEHQAAMVQLLANGSGIPASASRLAHAMHDLLGVVILQSAARENAVDIRTLFGSDDATTPGLNDKALIKREKALKTDSPAKWPTPAEQRVKELENTIKQLKAQRAKDKATIEDLKTREKALQYNMLVEQSGCRKPDTQVCEHDYVHYDPHEDENICNHCGAIVEDYI